MLQYGDMFSFLKNLFFPAPKSNIKITHLQVMTKAELEHLGRKHGIELDKRFKKPQLVLTLFLSLIHI